MGYFKQQQIRDVDIALNADDENPAIGEDKEKFLEWQEQDEYNDAWEAQEILEMMRESADQTDPDLEQAIIDGDEEYINAWADRIEAEQILADGEWSGGRNG